MDVTVSTVAVPEPSTSFSSALASPGWAASPGDGAGDVPWILVLNKIDKIPETEREELLKEFPEAPLVSAKDPANGGRVRDAIIGAFEADMTEVDLVVPYATGSVIGEIHHKIHVISES